LPLTENKRRRSVAASRTGRFLLGLVSGYLVVALSTAANLWLTPFALRYLDRKGYALFVVSSDALVWLGLFVFGTTAYLRAQVARLAARGETEGISRLASNAVYLHSALALVVLGCGAGLAFALPRALGLDETLRTEATLFLFLLVAGAAILFSMQTFVELLNAHQRTYTNNLIQLVGLLVRVSLTAWLLVLGGGLLGLAAASLCASAVVVALTVWLCYRTIPALKIKRHYVARAFIFGSLMSGAVWFQVGNVAGVATSYLDRFLAGMLVSLEAVTTLALTGRAYTIAGVLLVQMTTTAIPALGQLAASETPGATLAAYRHLTTLIAGGATVAAASIFAGNASFVTWWVGAQNYGGSPLDLALALSLIVTAWALPHRALLVADLTVRPHALTRLSEAALNLLLTVLLALHYGLPGIVVATAIAALTTSCWMLPRLIARRFGCRLRDLLWDPAKPLLVLACLLFVLAHMARWCAALAGGIVAALASMIFIAGCGCVLMWSFVFDLELRQKVKGVLARSFDKEIDGRIIQDGGVIPAADS
jgi:O-antigen/teichoic acid export membrane protein